MQQRADRLSEHPDIPPPTRMYNLASQVIVALGQGELDRAVRLVERFSTSPQEAGSFPDYLLLMLAQARLLLAQGHREEAAGLLTALCGMACQAGFQYLANQARALQAVATLSLDEALALLAEALTLAEPEGCVRTFVDAGESMATLLREAADRGLAAEYARKLLVAFGVPADGRVCAAPAHGRTPALVEPLSDREIEVLRLLDQGLTYDEIAHALYLSINTVKTHVRNIYGKQGVTRRRAATAQAKELDLLP